MGSGCSSCARSSNTVVPIVEVTTTASVAPSQNTSAPPSDPTVSCKPPVETLPTPVEVTAEKPTTVSLPPVIPPRTAFRPPLSIISAAKDGNLEGIRALLAKTDGSVDVNYRGMWDNTPLICACQYRHVDVALELIAAGADVCAVNEKGNTALLHASLEGLVTVVTALLARGAVVDVAPSLIYNSVTDSNQMLTPVTAATQNEHSDVLASLTLAVASAPRAAPTSPASAEEIQAPSPVHNSHAGTDQVAQLFAEATQPV